MKIVKTNFKYKQPLIPLDPNKVELIFIHHPATIKATPEQIHQWHLDREGFNGFAYNEYITKDGTVYIGRGDNIGAQVAGQNSKSYGICLEGNYDIEPSPSDELYKILAMRILETQKRFPKAKTILPHSARSNTSCPGRNFSMGNLYEKINELTKKEITIDEALRILQAEKVTESPNYWKNNIDKLEYLDKLIINMAKRLKN